MNTTTEKSEICDENEGEIKPAQLWAFLKDNDDVEFVGRICVALGGHDIKLTQSERAIVKMIERDSVWRKRQISRKSEQNRARVAKYDARKRAEKAANTASKGSMKHSDDVQSGVEVEPVTNVATAQDNKTITKTENATTQTSSQVETVITHNGNAQYPSKFEEIHAFLSSKKDLYYDEETLLGKFFYLRDNDWVDSSGKKVKNWKGYFLKLATSSMARVAIGDAEPK